MMTAGNVGKFGFAQKKEESANADFSDLKEKQGYPAEIRAFQHRHIPQGIPISKISNYF